MALCRSCDTRGRFGRHRCITSAMGLGVSVDSSAALKWLRLCKVILCLSGNVTEWMSPDGAQGDTKVF